MNSSLTSYRRLTLYTAIVGGGFLASKVLGLVREQLIARAFGTGPSLDAYYAAFNFPDLLNALIAGGALASVFIPVFSTYLVDPSPRQEGWRLASAVLNLVFLVVAALALLGVLAAQPLVSYVIAPGFDPARQALAADLMRLVFLSTLIFGVSGVVTGILHAHNSFLAPALAPPLYNLGIIAGALWLAPRWGIYGLAYGAVGGSVLHLLVQLPALMRHDAHYYPTLGLRNAGTGELLRLFGPRLVTVGVVRFKNLVLTNLASGLAAGSIAGLNYAYLVWQFPESMIGTAIALAVFPTLSRLAAKGAREQLARTLDGTLAVILALSIPSAVALMLLSEPVVTVIFRRGEFQSGSVALVAGILRLYALAVVGESALEVAARVFYAQHDSRTPMVVALGAMALSAALMLAWAGPYGAPGLALAYAVGVSAEAGTLYVLARRRFRLPAAGPATSDQGLL